MPAKKNPPMYWQQPAQKNKTHLRNNAQALLEIMLSTLLVCYSFSKIRHMQNINKIILYQIRVSERSLAQEEFYFITRDQQINKSIAKIPLERRVMTLSLTLHPQTKSQTSQTLN